MAYIERFKEIRELLKSCNLTTPNIKKPIYKFHSQFGLRGREFHTEFN